LGEYSDKVVNDMTDAASRAETSMQLMEIGIASHAIKMLYCQEYVWPWKFVRTLAHLFFCRKFGQGALSPVFASEYSPNLPSSNQTVAAAHAVPLS
jgi:hypothetical protein